MNVTFIKENWPEIRACFIGAFKLVIGLASLTFGSKSLFAWLYIETSWLDWHAEYFLARAIYFYAIFYFIIGHYFVRAFYRYFFVPRKCWG